MSEKLLSQTNGEINSFRIEGFSCANCANKFERNVKDLPGVQDAKVNFGASKLSVTGEATIAELEAAGAFENLKVKADNVRTVIDEENTEEEAKIPFYEKYQTLLYATLLIAFGFLSSFINGDENLVTVLLFLISMVIGGHSLFKVGLQNLVRFDFDMKTLMTVAVIGGAIIGEWAEVSLVVILFALSEELERFSMDRARQSIRSLMSIAPKQALIRRNGEEITIHVNDIAIGDTMIVKPGQKIAMDGVITFGHSAVNQAAITGESVPVEKVINDDVFAGTLNEEGFLEVRITKLVEDTTMSKIIHLVEEAQGERAPAQAFVDKFAKYYTPVIMLVALLVAVLPPLFFGGAWETWIYQGLAVLVVGCPCALVISTPISIVSAIGNAAKKGVLIKGGIYLEEMGSVKAIAFDKTGTLTKGVPVVTDYLILNEQIDEKELFSKMTALENYSQHPLASAVITKADDMQVSYADIQVEAFTSITGKGIQGTIEGITYYIGSPKLFEDHINIAMDKKIREMVVSLQNEGKTVMLVGTETELLAAIAVADEVRKSSQEVIQKLHDMGIEHTIMLTGDNHGTAKAIGEQLGVSEIQAELMPEDKLEYIKKLRKAYKNVAMVGDGVNDAPALAASTVGIAMGGAGTDTALETADVALMGDDLSKLPFTIKLSRKALNIIKANITFSIAIKIVALNSMRLMRVEE